MYAYTCTIFFYSIYMSTYACIYEIIKDMYICTNARRYNCSYVYQYMHIAYVWSLHVCIYVRMCRQMYIYVHVYICVYMPVCLYIYECMYVRIRYCTNAFIPIFMTSFLLL